MKDSIQEPEQPAATPERAAPTGVIPVIRASHCFVHKGKELELYCETCGELICLKCALKGGKHHDHDYEELDQAFEKYKVEMTSSLEPLEKQVTTITKALGKLNARCDEISNQRAATAGNVHITFRRLREILNVRETELIDQLDRMTQSKLKSLAAQRDEIETTLAQLHSCLHFTRESLRPDNKEDALMMKTNTENRVKEVTTPFQPHFLKPNAEADMKFLSSADMGSECQNYGQILTPDFPDPSQCHVDTKVAMVGERCAATLHLTNFRGEPCEEFMEALGCELVSDISGTRASCSVERRGQGLYEISYQPTIKGRHQLHIKVQGRHIRGSPFSVAVRSPVEKLGTLILTIGGVERPWGVAVNQRGEVVVAEWGGHHVSVFSPSGEKLRSFGTHGSGPGQMVDPREVAVDGEGNILVVDCGNHRIQRFTSEGQYSTTVGTKGSGHLQFSDPTGIAFNASNNKVYVGDTLNHRVIVLNSDLTISSTFGEMGSDNGQFSFPHGIACNSTGIVYVADWGNHRIQVCTTDGKFLRMFSSRGLSMEELRRPVGVAIDNSGIVYVSEGKNHRVSVFTSEGQFVTTFAPGPGEFEYPSGLAVDSSGVVHVCDRGNNRVHVF
jgi:tripartite motif-containing protein 2/3/tripartite motif-containing protein 71